MNNNHKMLNKNNTVNTKNVPIKLHYVTGNTFNYLCAQLQVSIRGFMEVER